jgi:energy-coupling factor transport system permease protein
MHPAIRILNLLILSVFLAAGGPLVLLFAACLLVATLPRLDIAKLSRLVQPVWRLRWLLLGILSIYVFFPVSAGPAGWARMAHGLGDGLLRVGALAGIVIAVQRLFATTERAELIAGLIWLLQPLELLHVPVTRFALRLTLTLETVPAAQALLVSPAPAPAAGGAGTRLRTIADAASGMLARALEAADRAPVVPIEIPSLPSPTAAQWRWPLSLLTVLALLQYAS